MKEFTIFVTESITHKVSVKAKNQEDAKNLLEKYTYDNDNAPKESEFYTKLDQECETDFENAVFKEA
jgi:hypothetical protein